MLFPVNTSVASAMVKHPGYQSSSSRSFNKFERKNFERGHRPIDSISTSSCSYNSHSYRSKSPEKNVFNIDRHYKYKRRRPSSKLSDHKYRCSGRNENHANNVSKHENRKRGDGYANGSSRVSSMGSERKHRRSRSRRRKEDKKRKAKHRSKKGNGKRKDSQIAKVGEIIANKYEVLKILGEGSYGQVMQCVDQQSAKEVAIKALKPLDNYHHIATHEVEVLKALANAEKNSNQSCCINALGFFEWHKIYFIITPKLSYSVFDFLEKNDFQPYSCQQAASITKQLLCASKFMFNIGLTHTDLKPENILFVNGEYDELKNKNGKTYRVIRDTTIKVIDFGSATYSHEHHSRTIQTRHYRAPEVILELGWSFMVDIWSIGCILFELVFGKCLFMTHDNLEHLAMMECVLGPIPKSFIRSTKRQSFFYEGRLDWNPNSRPGQYVKNHLKPIGDYWSQSKSFDHRLALDLTLLMIKYKPDERIEVDEALKHLFLFI